MNQELGGPKRFLSKIEIFVTPCWFEEARARVQITTASLTCRAKMINGTCTTLDMKKVQSNYLVVSLCSDCWPALENIVFSACRLCGVVVGRRLTSALFT